MPFFYFDIFDNGETIPDAIGTELADHKAAREEAVATLTSMADDRLPNDGSARDLAVHVRDANGDVILRVSLHFQIET